LYLKGKKNKDFRNDEYVRDLFAKQKKMK